MKKAFTLIELAIVLIIIGILIGTILYATEFRRSAEVRSTMKQLLNYQAAYNNFQDRYEARPGDFNRAYDFWPDNCESAEFCNGDGNGYIDSNKEAHLAWKHLGDSGFAPGNFAGQGYGGDDTQKADYNAPYGSLQGTQITLIYSSLDAFAPAHYFIIGGFNQGDLGYTAAIKPIYAARMDDKMDDGTPTGMLLGRNGLYNGDWNLVTCIVDEDGVHVANTDNLDDAIYNEDVDQSKTCVVAFFLD
ncbi:prepilin-type N-terminal cleavage/methylation domain-containing protein [Rickettsiales bacterium]|nr:prepilin-type N-terminal cleavage/methylation domain-containing protein [Rickettsiales bacterium]